MLNKLSYKPPLRFPKTDSENKLYLNYILENDLEYVKYFGNEITYENYNENVNQKYEKYIETSHIDFNNQNFIDNVLNKKYTFLNVLSEEDRNEFIKNLTEEEKIDIFKRSSISLNFWLNKLDNLKNIKHTYRIYTHYYVYQEYENEPIYKRCMYSMSLKRVISKDEKYDKIYWPWETNPFPDIDIFINESEMIMESNKKLRIRNTGCNYRSTPNKYYF